MTQCYGSFAKSAELAPCHLRSKIGTPRSIVGGGAFCPCKIGCNHGNPEGLRSMLWPCSVGKHPRTHLQSVRGSTLIGPNEVKRRRGHSLACPWSSSRPTPSKRRLGICQRLQEFWDFPCHPTRATPLDDHGLRWYASHCSDGAGVAVEQASGCLVVAWVVAGIHGQEDASPVAHGVRLHDAWRTGVTKAMLMHDHEALMAAPSNDGLGHPIVDHLVLFGVTWAVLDWVEAFRQ